MDFIEEIKNQAYGADVIDSQEQKELTSKYILPIIKKVMEIVIISREEFDKEFLKINKKSTKNNSSIYGKIDINHYPIGYCHDIKNGVLNKLKKHPLFIELINKGILLKEVFVILDNKYTQNAIQLGNIFIDVANDTINLTKEAIYYDNIENINFNNLDNYPIYFNMAEKYLNLKFYSNIYIPEIANIFPIISLDVNGNCNLFLQQEIILYKDITQNFKLSENFLQQNDFKNKVLPDIYQHILFNLKQNFLDLEYGYIKDMLNRYFTNDEPWIKSISVDLFQNEFFAIKNNLAMALNLIQIKNNIPLELLKSFRQNGIIPKEISLT